MAIILMIAALLGGVIGGWIGRRRRVIFERKSDKLDSREACAGWLAIVMIGVLVGNVVFRTTDIRPVRHSYVCRTDAPRRICIQIG